MSEEYLFREYSFFFGLLPPLSRTKVASLILRSGGQGESEALAKYQRSINEGTTKEERRKKGDKRGSGGEKIYFFFSHCLMWGYDWWEAVRRLWMCCTWRVRGLPS